MAKLSPLDPRLHSQALNACLAGLPGHHAGYFVRYASGHKNPTVMPGRKRLLLIVLISHHKYGHTLSLIHWYKFLYYTYQGNVEYQSASWQEMRLLPCLELATIFLKVFPLRD